MSAITNKLRAITLVVIVVGSVVGLGAVVAGQDAGNDGQTAGNDAEVTQSTSYLRVAHASPDAPAVDVYVDDELAFSNVSFGTASEYVAIEAGNYSVRITAAGQPNDIVFDDTVEVQARTVSTLTATGEVSQDGTEPFEVVGFLDDAYAPGENQSAVSVAHFSPDTDAVDVTVGGTDIVLADDLTYQNASDYVNVPAGEYTLEIREATADNNGTVIAFVDVELEGGTAYTGMALGYRAPDLAPANTSFQTSLLRDATTTVSLPAAPTPGNATATPTPGNVTPTPGTNATATPGNVTETPTNATATPTNATATPTNATATPTNATATPTPGNVTPTPGTNATATATDTAGATATPTEAEEEA